jgi:hypothetical protein
MATKKSVSFVAPYTSATFAELVKYLTGPDGYLAGAETTDDGTDATVAPFVFVQNGIVVEVTEASLVTPATPIGDGPLFLTASNPDDDPASEVILSITGSIEVVAAGAVILAYKVNGVWRNPESVAIATPAQPSGSPSARVSGLYPKTQVVGGYLTGVQVSPGRVVDKEGVEFEFGSLLSHPVLGQSKYFDRTDHIVVRRREKCTPEMKLLLGPTFPSTGAPLSYASAVFAGVKPYSVFGARGGRNYAARGGATGLYVANGSTETLFTIGTALDNAWIAGQRSSDQAIVIVYTEGTAIKMVAVDVVGTAIATAAVTVLTKTGAIAGLRATMGLDNLVHLVFQHDEGIAPPSQQVYWATASSAVATFGALGVSPVRVSGTPSGMNDTCPSIGVDRRGFTHIAYTSGTLSNEYGELKRATFDAAFAVVSRETVSTFGGPATVASEPGLAALTFDYVTNPVVVVTPHDEVYIFVRGQKNGDSGTKYVLISGPGFADRLGYDLVTLPIDAAVFTSHAAFSDELGQLHFSRTVASSLPASGRLDTVFAPNGVLAESLLEEGTYNSGGTFSFNVGALGGGGEALWSCSASSGGSSAANIVHTRATGRRFTPHASDTVLESFLVPSGTAGIPEISTEVSIAPAKNERRPIIVGDGGDYSGYDAIGLAVDEANARGGGEIVVRGGEHVIHRNIEVLGGVKIRGEGAPRIILSPQCRVRLGVEDSIPVDFIISQVVAYTGDRSPRPGDVILMSASGMHVIRRLLSGNRIVVASPAPMGSTFKILSAGVGLRDLIFSDLDLQSGEVAVHASYLYGAEVHNLLFSGSSEEAYEIYEDSCQYSLFTNLQFMLSGTTDNIGMAMLRGTANRVSRCYFGTGCPLLVVGSTADEEKSPSIIDCNGAKGADPDIVISDATRTTPVQLVGCDARFSSFETYAKAAMHTKRVTSPLGAGPLKLSDDNTTNPIELSSGTAVAFDGATPAVLIASVNERLKKSGGTITGAILPNATGIDLGSAAARFDIYAETLTAYSTVLLYGPTTLGDQSTDVISVNGTMTILNQTTNTFTCHPAAVFNGHVTLGNAAADNITINGTMFGSFFFGDGSAVDRLLVIQGGSANKSVIYLRDGTSASWMLGRFGGSSDAFQIFNNETAAGNPRLGFIPGGQTILTGDPINIGPSGNEWVLTDGGVYGSTLSYAGTETVSGIVRISSGQDGENYSTLRTKNDLMSVWGSGFDAFGTPFSPGHRIFYGFDKTISLDQLQQTGIGATWNYGNASTGYLSTGTGVGNWGQIGATSDARWGFIGIQLPGMKARVKFTGALTNRLDRIGYSGGLFYFRYDPTLSAYINLVIMNEDLAGVDQTDIAISTAFTPVLGTWYWLYAVLVTNSILYYEISTDPEGELGVGVVAGGLVDLIGTYTPDRRVRPYDIYVDYVRMAVFVQTTDAVDKRLYIDELEFFTLLKGSPTA